MKKLFKPAFAVFVFVLFLTNSFSFSHPVVSNKKALLLTYEWYRDQDLYDATGSVLTPADEIARLNNLHSGYTFTIDASPGLSAFEYGFYPSQNLKVIYSNLSY
jgi:hypothetical protein